MNNKDGFLSVINRLTEENRSLIEAYKNTILLLIFSALLNIVMLTFCILEM